jgi:hypothetical protein
MRGHDCPSERLRLCGVSSLTLSVIATAASTQPNTMILSVVIALGPSGPDQGELVATVPGESAGHSDPGHMPTLRINLACILPRMQEAVTCARSLCSLALWLFLS